MNRRCAVTVVALLGAAVLGAGGPVDAAGGPPDVDTVREEAGHAATMLVDSPLPAIWAADLDGIESGAIDDPTRLAEIDAEAAAVLSAIVVALTDVAAELVRSIAPAS